MGFYSKYMIMQMLFTFIIVAVASLIKGITGFGFALVSMPLLLLWYPAKELVPALVMCNLFASTIIILQKKERKLVPQQFQTLIAYGTASTIFGVLALKYMPENLIITAISILFILLAVLSLLGKEFRFKPQKYVFKLAGFITGFLTGSISVSGPPLALFLNAVDVDNQQFREIFSWFSVLTSIVAVTGYVFTGVLSLESIKMTLMFIPVLFIGSYIGKRINNGLSNSFFQKANMLLTLLSSIFLLITG
jgi:hypothetical protein